MAVITEDQYEKAQKIIDKIIAKKKAVISAYLKELEGFELFVENKSLELGEVLDDSFYEVEKEAKRLIEAFELQDSNTRKRELGTYE